MAGRKLKEETKTDGHFQNFIWKAANPDHEATSQILSTNLDNWLYSAQATN